MNIDQTAPMSARKEIFIDAPVERVWAVQTGIKDWPAWQADLSNVEMEGNLAVGTTFKWKTKGVKITSTIQELEAGRRIGWTGSSIGTKAIHIWTFEARGNGTHVTTEESMSGWFPSLIRIFDPAFLEKSLAGSLRALKDEAERQ
jgi:uncharacterized protein YndB with AHSA1/START domain